MNNKSNNFWQAIAEAQATGQSLVAATVVKDTGSVPRRTGAKMLVYQDGTSLGSVGGGLFESLIIRDALNALSNGQSETRTYSFNPKGANAQSFGAVCGGRADVFLEVIMSLDKLLIVGGGHCGRALALAASHLDFSITVIDDRAEYARPEDFEFQNVESVQLTSEDFSALPHVDSNTYVVLVSKGFITDEAALRRVINSPAAYIGMIGSKRKREVVYNNMRSDGIPEESLTRVHAPIGLDIGSETPEEIAISILAEIIQVRARKRQDQNNKGKSRASFSEEPSHQ